MRVLFLLACVLLTFDSLQAFLLSINDTSNKYYLTSSLGIILRVKDRTNSSVWHRAEIKGGSASLQDTQVRNESVFYTFTIRPESTISIVKSLNLTVETQHSKDKVRRYVNEFDLHVQFSASSLSNISDAQLAFLVKPPRFPHFQVKSDWQYHCPKNLSLNLCHIENATASKHCSQWVSELVTVELKMTDIRFSGGKTFGYSYVDRVEECPLAYEPNKGIGIGFIVGFWTIVLAFGLWGLIKYLVKRHKKRLE